MSDETGNTVKLKSHIIVEVVLVLALAVYLVLAGNDIVGANILFTAVGAGLMALVTFWTLNTAGDIIELVAQRLPSKGA